MRRCPVKSTLKWKKKNSIFIGQKNVGYSFSTPKKSTPGSKKTPGKQKSKAGAGVGAQHKQKTPGKSTSLHVFVAAARDSTLILMSRSPSTNQTPLRRSRRNRRNRQQPETPPNQRPPRVQRINFRQSWRIAIPFALTKEFWFCRNASGHFQLRRRLLQRNKRNLK